MHDQHFFQESERNKRGIKNIHIYINGYLPAKARSIASELLGGFGP